MSLENESLPLMQHQRGKNEKIFSLRVASKTPNSMTICSASQRDTNMKTICKQSHNIDDQRNKSHQTIFTDKNHFYGKFGQQLDCLLKSSWSEISKFNTLFEYMLISFRKANVTCIKVAIDMFKLLSLRCKRKLDGLIATRFVATTFDW